MTTYYTQVPTLEMRVAASSVIITGTVGKIVDTQIEYYDHEPFTRTTYEVMVQEVLKGTLEHKVIRVEVMGGQTAQAAAAPQESMQEGAPLVLMLVPEEGRNTFVPYFSSAFPLVSEEQIELGPRAELLSSSAVSIKGGRITLDTLRRLIEAAAREEAAETKAAVAMMAGQPLPPVLEMPQGFRGGGEPSAPEIAEQVNPPKESGV